MHNFVLLIACFLIGIGLRPRFAPGSDDDLASVDQIVT